MRWVRSALLVFDGGDDSRSSLSVQLSRLFVCEGSDWLGVA